MIAKDTRAGGRHCMRERAPAAILNGSPPATAPIWELLGFDSLAQAMACWRVQVSVPHGMTPEDYRRAA